MKVNLNVAGAFNKFNIIIKQILKNKNVNFTVFDGVENLPWNGGRVNYLYNTNFDLDKLKIYNKLGVGVFITFSNQFIDITDKRGNEILEYLNVSSLNGVIIVNENLRKHIRENFKNLKIMFSVTGFNELDLNFIKNLETKYDLICPRFEWVFNPKFYHNVNSEKYKIMLNDTCKENCELWSKHFLKINEANRDNISDPNVLRKIQECWIKNEIDNPNNGWRCNSPNSGMDLNKYDIKKCLKIGYHNFKLSGREMQPNEFKNDLESYLNIFSRI